MNTKYNERNKARLLALFECAYHAVSAKHCLPQYLPKTAPKGRTIILGAGKAAAAMAAAAVRHLNAPLGGLVVTRYGHECPIPDNRVEVLGAAHPVPDQRSVIAAQQMLVMARQCNVDDRLIFLASGGGSSVLCLPVPGLSLLQKQETIHHLQYSGADIAQINCVRKHLSGIKGGRLAAASGTKDIQTYLISDVVGDDPSMIASGPTIADPTSLADARAVIARHGSPHQKIVMALLHEDTNETPKPGTLPGKNTIVAKPADALKRAEKHARKQGWHVHNLGDKIEGEAKTIGEHHAEIALDLKQSGGRWLLLSGGEVTVRVRNKNGCGGPNLEYLAGLALALKGAPGITALACDTDGIDGSEQNAGAFVTPCTLSRAETLGINLRTCLENNQTHLFFKTLDDLIHTGPTLTNVNDFRAIIIDPQ